MEDRETDLPSGVVTFLLTDVVDSTALWERSPKAMALALERHDDLIDDAVRTSDGFLLKHRGEGDSTFAVFAKPSAALAAACAAQRALAAETWDATTPIYVRMGVHTGEAIERGRDYYGQTVNRAARLRALASAGQVLVSGTTAQLVGDVPEGSELVFLGRQTLRGIDTPEPVHELVDLTLPRRVPEPTEPERHTSWPIPLAIARAAQASFAGRTKQLALLARVRANAAAGSPHVVLLGGEPGAGKTTLAAQAASAAHSEGWTVLHGTCDDELAIPYEPFREVLDQYVAAAPRTLLADHVASHGGEIARLAPRLSTRVGTIAPVDALDQETARQLLAGAVTDLVQRAATDTPLMIVLDDLHWADRSTLMLLRRLARLGGRMSCMIVATYRVAAEGENDFRDVLPDLLSLPSVTDVRVEGLDQDELMALLEGAAGPVLGEASASVARYLAGETGGNPFFATEMLRHFAETGVIGRDDNGHWRIQVALDTVAAPETVRGVLAARLARLGEPTMRALRAGSVLGREFDLAVLARVIDTDVASLLDTIEEAVDAALVREVSAGRFTFSHALVQHALYDDLGATRRAIHHHRVAETLERSGGVSAAEIASHWVAANGSSEASTVADWARKAGDEAREQLAPDEAVRWYRMALDRADGADGAARVRLMIALGDSVRWAGGDGWRETLLDAASLAEGLGDKEALVEAALANNRGGTSRSGATDTERIAVLEKALVAVGARDSADRARLLATLCIELSQSPEWEERVALADEAIACARRLDDPLTLLRVLMLTTEATRLPHTYDRRLAETDELFSIAKRLGDPVLLGIAALRQARILIEGARTDEVDDAMSVLGAVADLHPYTRWNRPVLQAVLAHVAGDLAAAATHCETALRIARADGQPDALQIYMAEIVMIRYDEGRLGELEPQLAAVVADNPRVTGFRGLLALAWCELGRLDDARSLLQSSVDAAFSDHPYGQNWLSTMTIFASVCRELEHVDGARMLYEILEPWRDRTGASPVSIAGFVQPALAELAIVIDDVRAEQDLGAAIALEERIGARAARARTRLAAASLLVARGDSHAARTELEAAIAQSSALGMRGVSSRATAMLARVDAPQS